MTAKKRVLTIGAIIGVPLLGWWLLFVLSSGDKGNKPSPPEFVLYVKQPEAAIEGSLRPGNWDPRAVTAIGNRLFILDSGNDRILELNDTGKVTAVLCEADDCAFLLKNAQSITNDKVKLYVANTGAEQVVVLYPDGSVVETIKMLISGVGDGDRFSPAGIAVSRQGDIYVSDLKRNLVARRSADGAWSTVLAAWNDSLKYRANGPLGLAVDARDNLYVANSGDGTIRLYSAAGRHLQEFSMRSNPAFFSPAHVAVDPPGNVYFTDNRSRVVYVYQPAGELIGTVGLLDGSRVDSPAVLREPMGIHFARDTLYVADRAAGVFGFQIDPDYWRSTQPARGRGHP